MEMKIASNIKPVTSLGYQLIFDEAKRIISINLLHDKKILVKNRLTNPIELNDDINVKDLVDSAVLEYFNTRINCQTSNEKTKKSKADFYSNVMSAKKR
jgi:hypothetical protein